MKKSIATILTIATVSLLAGCGSHPLAMNGLQLDMPLNSVRAAAPANTQLYCKGDGNSLIDGKIAEKTSGWNTNLKYCVWASVASYDVAPLKISNSVTSSYVLVFAPKPGAEQQASANSLKAMIALAETGQEPVTKIPDSDWHLDTYRADFPVNTYQPLVADLTTKLGKPHQSESKDSIMPYVESTWWNDDNTVYAEVYQTPASFVDAGVW
jgi:hypothetical protein